MIFKGFLFGLGIVLAIIAIVLMVLLILGSFFVIRLRSKYVSTRIWESYLADLTQEEDFEEAALIRKMLAENRGKEKIKLPKGYGIQVGLRICEDQWFPFAFNRHIVILKTKKVLKDYENKESEDGPEEQEV